MPSEQELIELRLQKRAELLARSDPYPATVRRSHTTAQAAALLSLP